MQQQSNIAFLWIVLLALRTSVMDWCAAAAHHLPHAHAAQQGRKDTLNDR